VAGLEIFPHHHAGNETQRRLTEALHVASGVPTDAHCTKPCWTMTFFQEAFALFRAMP